jgi:protein-tyrosine phosphatase
VTNRHIEFEACFNFRDLGGYRTADGKQVRRGRLFRSADLRTMTPNDIARARDEIGITTVLDLKAAARDPKKRLRGLNEPPTRYLNVPLISPEADEEYVARFAEPDSVQILLNASIPQLPGIFEILADESAYPLVFHCVAGKDRSGIVAALILSALGVDDEQVVDDYAQSGLYLEALMAYVRSLGAGDVIDNAPDGYFDSPSEVMQSLLAGLHAEHGSTLRFLENVGVRPQNVEAVRNNILEPSSS